MNNRSDAISNTEAVLSAEELHSLISSTEATVGPSLSLLLFLVPCLVFGVWMLAA